MLAVTGGKGGVGRTTVALGLASALARHGGHPVVIDADRRVPDLHAVAGVAGVPGVAAVAAGRKVALPRRRPGLEIVPARPATTLRQLRMALGTLAGLDRPVLVDCPAGAGSDAVHPLRVADRALLVTTADAAAIRGAGTTARIARGLDTSVVGVVATRTETASPIREALEVPVLGCVPALERPLADERARAVYAAVVEHLDQQNA